MVAAVVDRFQEEDPPLLDRLLSTGVEVHPIRVHPRAYLKERGEVADLCRRLAPDVVHTHGPRPDVLDSGAARRRGIPTVTTVHGSSKFKGMMRYYEWLQEHVWFRRFDAVVAVSAPLLDELGSFGVPRDKLHLIPNAWNGGAPPLERADARRLLGLPDDGPCVGWVGRMIPAKGADVMLESIGLVPNRGVTFSFVGDGPDRPQLERRARDLENGADVRFHGTLDLAARLLPAFDVLVLSSRTEGTPVVLLEGMACGVPLVVTAVGGVPAVVGDSEALAVPPQQPEALARAISTCLSDESGARVRAANAKRRLESEFAVEPWLEKYESVYRRVAHAGRS